MNVKQSNKHIADIATWDIVDIAIWDFANIVDIADMVDIAIWDIAIRDIADIDIAIWDIADIAIWDIADMYYLVAPYLSSYHEKAINALYELA